MKYILFFILLSSEILCQKFTPTEIAKWEKQSQNVTIIRDNFGVPHVYGKTDADAVFGLLYAQCEDDFQRVEMNYIEKLGRLSEVTGEGDIYNDLLIRLVIDTIDAKKDYNKAAPWLKAILNAYADGINYYLHKNPDVKPALISRFQPWFPLLWTDGSIGAISTGGISLSELKKFYSGKDEAISTVVYQEESLSGSNGFAFSPKITSSGNAILYINPHVTFYFRPEVHMISEEGLNAYGAVTWGQPFIYQGFNENCGWMHTSSQADISDSYIEKLVEKKGKWYYEYEGKLKAVIKKQMDIRYKSGTEIKTQTFNALFTHHGPIMAKRDGKYLSLRHNNRDTNGFIQSWIRTKAKNFEEFKKAMDMGANPSNNTVYADGEGNIAYWHGNFLPKRDPNFDWSQPVDGSTKATEWKGYHTVGESVHLYNPENGWLQNCNSTPFTVAGKNSPDKSKFANYLAPDGENFRGINAVRVLEEEKEYDLDKVIKAGYDTRMSVFDILVPRLVQAFETEIAYQDSLYPYLIGPISVLKNWDTRSSISSVATTLAIEWVQRLQSTIAKIEIPSSNEQDIVSKTTFFAKTVSNADILKAFSSTISDLESRFGKWQIPWGDINRIQRISPDIENKFDDTKPSFPVGFASSAWGMLP
ncbi:MAG: penicillin acylase family protein, partial [Saprospiraceae bacterium]